MLIHGYLNFSYQLFHFKRDKICLINHFQAIVYCKKCKTDVY